MTSANWVKFTFTKPLGGASRTLILNLTGGNDVSPSVNFSRFTYTIR